MPVNKLPSTTIVMKKIQKKIKRLEKKNKKLVIKSGKIMKKISLNNVKIQKLKARAK